MHNYFNKICTIFFIFVAIAITNTACCAKGVPNYNPKDPNPKPGLYYVGETKYFPGYATVLKDGRVLIIERPYEDSPYRYQYLEIFDPSIGKFTKIKDFLYPLNLSTCFNGSHHSILLDDGRVLFNAGVVPQEEYPSLKTPELYQIYDPVNDSFSVVGRSKMCRTFVRHGDKVYPYYANIIPYLMTKLNDGRIVSYCSNTREKDEMEIIDVKNNTISTPIKKGDKDYITPVKYKGYDYSYKDFMNSYHQLYPNLQKPVDNAYFHKLTDSKYLIVSRGEADYGIPAEKIKKNRYTAWFCPLYEYNPQTKKLEPKNEYLRSLTGSIYHLNNTNKMIIVGGFLPSGFFSINPNSAPSKVSLSNRLLYPSHFRKVSKKIYIYVYQEE